MPIERTTWPNGARCAVALTWDNFGESYDLLRYGHAAGAFADGIYVIRRGIERVMEMLDRQSVPGTFFLEGWNVAKYADFAAEIESRGHEIAGHGWMHERWNTLDPEAERDLISRTMDAFNSAVGHAPVGWRSPGGLMTPATLPLLHEFGVKYDSSFADEDVPYRVRVAADSSDDLVELPMAWPYDDATYYAYPGAIRRPSDVAALWIEEFDAIYDQAGYFMLVCHPRYSGRPARILAVERLVEHMKTKEGVLFARCHEIAEHARQAATTPQYAAPEVMSV